MYFLWIYLPSVTQVLLQPTLTVFVINVPSKSSQTSSRKLCHRNFIFWWKVPLRRFWPPKKWNVSSGHSEAPQCGRSSRPVPLRPVGGFVLGICIEGDNWPGSRRVRGSEDVELRLSIQRVRDTVVTSTPAVGHATAFALLKGNSETSRKDCPIHRQASNSAAILNYASNSVMFFPNTTLNHFWL